MSNLYLFILTCLFLLRCNWSHVAIRISWQLLILIYSEHADNLALLDTGCMCFAALTAVHSLTEMSLVATLLKKGNWNKKGILFLFLLKVLNCVVYVNLRITTQPNISSVAYKQDFGPLSLKLHSETCTRGSPFYLHRKVVVCCCWERKSFPFSLIMVTRARVVSDYSSHGRPRHRRHRLSGLDLSEMKR